MEPYSRSPQIFPISCLVKHMGNFTNHKKTLLWNNLFSWTIISGTLHRVLRVFYENKRFKVSVFTKFVLGEYKYSNLSCVFQIIIITIIIIIIVNICY